RNKAAELELAKAKQEAEMAKELQKQAAELAQAEKVRQTEMELQRQKQEAKIAKEIQKQEAEIAKELQKQEAEKEERKAANELQRQKQEAEIAERKAANELLQQKQAAEIELQRSKIDQESEIDLARLEQQRTLAESESRMRMHESDNRSRVTEERMSGGGDSHNSFRKYDLGLGTFSNNDKVLEPFLTKFEVVAEAYKLPRSLWAVELAKSLTGESLMLYETLSAESRLDYYAVVEAIKKRFGVTIRTCRKKFLQAKCQDNESQKDFVIRLRKYYLEWLKKAEYNQNFEEMLEHIVMDRYYESQTQ